MKKNNEMESQDLRVDNDIQVSEDGHSIIAYLETWFDVERKFGVDLSAEDAWLNLNAMYDPFADKLVMAYEVSTDDNYTPTENEIALVKAMIAEKIQELYNQTPQEFCREVQQEDHLQMEEQT